MGPAERMTAACVLAALVMVALAPSGARAAVRHNPWEALPPTTAGETCVEGPVGDAACESSAVERANADHLHAVLEELADTTFFRLFRADLSGKCPFERFGGGADAAAEGCPSAAAGADAGEGGGGASSCDVRDDAHARILGDAARTSDPVDTTLSSAEDRAAGGTAADDAACDDDDDLPEFWLDLCEAAGGGGGAAGGGGEMVNLRRNVESDTGYNGTDIWRAIYEENCFVGASGGAAQQAMCFEERVLFRLLSGMHTSINVHVAMDRNVTKKGRDGGPPPSAAQLYRWQFGGEKAERLRNLHFAFVVMLRALAKGADLVRAYDFRSFAAAAAGAGADDADDGARTAALAEHLIGSCALRSCASVFDAFDERQLFGASPSHAAVTGAQQHTWWSLKRQFKGVFHNISRIADCVPCQKCRLHFKVQLLGIGTALKWLLLPPELIASATSRDELVAFVNTLAKFSRAIAWSTQLGELAAAASAAEGVAVQPQASGAAHGAPSGGTKGAAAGTEPLDAHAELDRAVGLVARARRAGLIDDSAERSLLARALRADAAFASLVRHYGDDAMRHLPLLAEGRGAAEAAT